MKNNKNEEFDLLKAYEKAKANNFKGVYEAYLNCLGEWMDEELDEERKKRNEDIQREHKK